MVLLLTSAAAFCQEIQDDSVTESGLVFIDSFYGDRFSIRAMQVDSTRLLKKYRQ